MREELLKGLTEEQIKKVKACKTSAEILNLAKAEGIGLNEEQLAAISGGACGDGDKPLKCPKCGSKDWEVSGPGYNATNVVNYLPITGCMFHGNKGKV